MTHREAPLSANTVSLWTLRNLKCRRELRHIFFSDSIEDLDRV